MSSGNARRKVARGGRAILSPNSIPNRDDDWFQQSSIIVEPGTLPDIPTGLVDQFGFDIIREREPAGFLAEELERYRGYYEEEEV